mmetsp:Transcript_53068/g.128779  ORF Transcript_53068/g.128779 Transcript_53068/m.128779 type:complete len:621 (+) Transcript_53068:136-1998(+)
MQDYSSVVINPTRRQHDTKSSNVHVDVLVSVPVSVPAPAPLVDTCRRHHHQEHQHARRGHRQRREQQKNHLCTGMMNATMMETSSTISEGGRKTVGRGGSRIRRMPQPRQTKRKTRLATMPILLVTATVAVVISLVVGQFSVALQHQPQQQIQQVHAFICRNSHSRQSQQWQQPQCPWRKSSGRCLASFTTTRLSATEKSSSSSSSSDKNDGNGDDPERDSRISNASKSVVSRMWNRVSKQQQDEDEGDGEKKKQKKKQKKQKKKDGSTDGDSSSKSGGGVPLVGRLFSSSSSSQKDEDENVNESSSSSSSSNSVFRIFSKTKDLPLSDAEILRREVFKQQEERTKRLSEIQQKQQTQQIEQELKETELRRKIDAQKAADERRQIQLEKNRAEREEKGRSDKKTTERKADSNRNDDGNDDSTSEKKSSGRIISVVQKSIMSIFDSGGKEEWVVVAPKTRISPGESVPITVAGIDLLLVASKDGSALHCIANSCPHLGTPLELGMLDRRLIEPSRNTGTTTTATATTPSKSYADISAVAAGKKKDGCEDCIVCPLHKTAFALESGEVRGEWCPYPPVIGKVTGALKKESSLAVFDVRINGKNIEVKLNTPFDASSPTKTDE